MQDLNELVQSKAFRGALTIVGIALAALVIFQAGEAIGFRKAAFSYRFGDNYYRAFSSERGPKSFRMQMRGGFMEAHGAAGRIVSINLPTFVVSGPDEVEKVVLIGDDTEIRHFDTSVAASELRVGDFAVVIGSPNENSQIEAELVRILPPPATVPDTEQP